MPPLHNPKRLAVIWTNFGPYHLARLRALAPCFDLHAIELATFQRLYRWEKQDNDLQLHTLRNGDWEDQSQLGVALDLWRKLNKLHPSIIFVPGYASLPALCASLWGRLHRAGTVLMSESNIDDHPRHRFSEAVKRTIVMLLFDAAIVGGNRAAKYVKRLGMPKNRIGRKYDVVDNEYFASRASQCRLEGQHSGKDRSLPYFLFVGRLAPEKNISRLLDAFSQYVDSGGGWRLVVAGDGALNESLRNQARTQIDSGSVVFAGHKTLGELPMLYAHADCFVLPSIREPWGLVVNEAMASGLPIIVSSRCGCADDLLEEGSNGFVIDPTSASSIASALLRMASLTDADRARMGRRSQAIVADYSPERWSHEVRQIVGVVTKDASNR